jgi:AcrR family transcriptional regulator
MEALAQCDRPEPALLIKAAALRLFAEHGVAGVTVRQIAEAAGQKNHAALTYYFGSKDALVREIIVDGARAIDDRRNAWLDACEADDGPGSVSEVMRGLARTSVDPDPPPEGECYNRFIVVLQLSNRSLFTEALADRWNSGYLRCLDHVRRLMPGVPVTILNQRLVFMGGAINGILASRETELADRSRDHPMWADAATLDRVGEALARIVAP